MTIKARVHNHTIVLPPGVEIADGSEVQVIVPDDVRSANGSVHAFIAQWAGAFTAPESERGDERLAYLLQKHVK